MQKLTTQNSCLGCKIGCKTAHNSRGGVSLNQKGKSLLGLCFENLWSCMCTTLVFEYPPITVHCLSQTKRKHTEAFCETKGSPLYSCLGVGTQIKLVWMVCHWSLRTLPIFLRVIL